MSLVYNLISDSLWYTDSPPKRHTPHGSLYVHSYSSSYSNINGKESGSTQKYVASHDSNGKRHGKLFRERKRGLDKRSYTRQLTDREVEHTLNYTGNAYQTGVRCNRHSDTNRSNNNNPGSITQNQPDYLIQPHRQTVTPSDTDWYNLGSLDIIGNTMSSQPFTNPWENDPFFTDS
jgi:hypothetical protein